MRKTILLGALVVCSPTFAQDATFRGNAEHTGVYSGVGVPQFSKIKWQFHTGGQVMSSPAVTADTVYIGSNDHFLYALDRATGAQLWKFKTESRITS
jgi:eukaryotic-like serine/threonine-protein kinase